MRLTDELLRAGMVMVVCFEDDEENFVVSTFDPQFPDRRIGMGKSSDRTEAEDLAAVHFTMAGLRTDTLWEA